MTIWEYKWSQILPFDKDRPFMEVLGTAGFDVDQKLQSAMEICWRKPRGEVLFDNVLFRELARLNVKALRPLLKDLGEPAFFSWFQNFMVASNAVPTVFALLYEIFGRACSELARNGVVTANRIARLILEDALSGSSPLNTTASLVLAYQHMFGLNELPFANAKLRDRLLGLGTQTDSAEDYEFTLSINEQGKFAFHIPCVVDDYVQQSTSGILFPHRVLITSLSKYGLFTGDQLAEFEALINSPHTTEDDLQRFFEQHPHFLWKWNHREVHPQIYLTRADHRPLVPDFILTNNETQDAAIVEIKRANMGTSLVRRQKNRIRFADTIMEARAQLLEYQAWFDNPRNREILRPRLGMDIYRPRLMVLIGRSSAFRDEVDRALLRERTPGIDVVTYDDVLRYAIQRKVFIES